MTFRCK